MGPGRPKATTNDLRLAKQLTVTFEANMGRRQADLDEDLRALEAGTMS